MHGTAPLRVCIDARLQPGARGGVEQVVVGIAHGLSRLQDGEEEYVFLVHPDSEDWLAPYVAGRASLLRGELSSESRKEQARRIFPRAHAAWQTLSPLAGKWTVSLPRSDGTIEAARVHVMHFPIQDAFLTGIPSIYHPWDLQHIHLPHFFTPRERLVRDVRYRAFCEQAEVVVVAGGSSRHDLIDYYGISEQKICLVPIGPATDCYRAPTEADLAAARLKFDLPDRFAFYPSHTWPHKNHLALIDALAILRHRGGPIIPLVCSGTRTDFYATLEARIREVGLVDQVRFVDYVESLDIRCLYELCECVVFPTKFEGWGMPLTEAFAAEKPALCSNISPLREQAGGAALLFDPDSAEEIAVTLARIWQSKELRLELSEKGRGRAELFSWDRAARIFRALYRRIGDIRLTDEDLELLARGAQSVIAAR
jgi:glycosyltransferase involved in cell wall biosynthesis